MFKKRIIIGLMSIMLLPLGIAHADDFFVYPEAGQSQEQTSKDKYECAEWAKGQTGFDPMATPTATTPPPAAQPQKGGVVKGAATGALAGVAVGAITGKSQKKSAGVGAVAGGLLGGMRRNDQVASQKQAEDQWAQQQAYQYQQGRNNFDRAYRACLEGRKYSVK